MRRLPLLILLVAVAAGLSAIPRSRPIDAAGPADFVHFESSHVHPLAMTPDGSRLLVVNTPDNRLSVFDLTGPSPLRIAEIPVGLEPVSVATRSNDEAWVVNNLSDDVSIVDLGTLHVRATLRVGDEPSDVVFAGSPQRAYVSVSQEDRIRVYDPDNLTAPPANIAIDGRMPRALARTADGTQVYAAVFHAGNRTSVLSEAEVPNDSLPSDSLYPRDLSLASHVRPQTGLMVQQQADGNWRDMYGKLWNYRIKYTVRDVDVAEIATASNTVTRTFGDLGAVNFGLAVSASDGRIAVTTTEARNVQRLEPRLEGHMVDTRLAIVTVAGTASIRELNSHVIYSGPGTQAERDSAIGIPTGVAFSGNGARAYATSLASNRLAVLDPSDGASPTVLARVPTVAGPTGVLVDDGRGRIYVVGRFRNQLQTLSSTDFSEIGVAGIGFDPTPDDIVNGRKFFYGGFTSRHGEEACASCHVFGDFDNLAWDLGNPSGQFQPPPPGQIDRALEGFDPEKGPMTTQSLRGLPGTALLHWRGDRADLNAFQPAFVNLMGRGALPDSEMAAFSDFTLALVYPPNPHEHLDRTMPDAPSGQPSAQRGQTFFMNNPTDGGVLTCNQCHAVPTGTNGQVIDDAALQEDQDIKVPQLRNMYKKTGFTDLPGAVNKRGFGFIHDGSVDNLFNFLQFPGFNFGSPASVANANRRDVEAFLLAFDTGLAPSVGYQITFDGANNDDADLIARLDTLRNQAALLNCDLVAKGRTPGLARGWKYQGGDQWKSDAQNEAIWSTAALLRLASKGQELTITGVPPGSGTRIGIDRDRDGWLDGDELLGGGDPGNPAIVPSMLATPPASGAPIATFALHGVHPNPFRGNVEAAFTLGRAGRVDLVVTDVLGRRVRSVASGLRLPAGAHVLAWDGQRDDGSSAATGVYFVTLGTEGGRWSRAVVRVR